MANGSIREAILEFTRSSFAANTAFKTVERSHPTFKELKVYAEDPAAVPFVGIIGGLPEPDLTLRSRGRVELGKSRSSMDISIIVFGIDPTTPDSSISYYADEAWKTVMSDPSYGGNCVAVEINPENITYVAPPYWAFMLVARVQYIHGSLSI